MKNLDLKFFLSKSSPQSKNCRNFTVKIQQGSTSKIIIIGSKIITAIENSQSKFRVPKISKMKVEIKILVYSVNLSNGNNAIR